MVLALIAGIAIVFSIGGEDTQPTTDLSAIPAPVVTGEPLTPYDPTLDVDASSGMPAPEVVGSDFQLNPVEIVADGRPKVLLFLAHWCPHCQAEVPRVQQWLDAGGRPAAVDFYSVATSIDAAQPNYPPDRWLERERWSPPVLVDTDGSVARAYGLTSFPYWVFVDANGAVFGRVSTEMPQEALTDLFSLLVS